MRLISILLSVLLAEFLYHSVAIAADYKIRFNGVNYVIPKAYFPIWARPKILDEPRALVLRVYFPNISPLPTRPLPKKLKGGHGDKVSVVIKKQPSEMNAAYAHMAATRIESTPYKNEHGLRAFLAAGRFRQPPPDPRRVLFAHENQIVKVLIVCEPWHRSPSCQHTFNADKNSFELRYAMRHLADWKKIQTGIVDKFHNFGRTP